MRAIRLINKFSPVPAAVLLLVACGGSGGGGDAVDLRSPEVVARQVSSLLATTDGAGGSATAARKSLQDGECDSGSDSAIQQDQVDVGSPYTGQPFDLAGLRYDNCRLNDENSGEFLVFDGEIKGGEVTGDDAVIEYFRFGDGASPFAVTAHGENNGQSSDLSFAFSLVLHGREASNQDFDGELFMLYDGEAAASGIEADFRFRLGVADAAGDRFVLGQSADGMTVDGEYEIDVDETLDRALECSALARVATSDPLRTSDSTTLYAAGELVFSSGGESATVVFDDRNRVTITTSRGTTTMSQDELLQQGRDCAGLFTTGFAFAAAAG